MTIILVLSIAIRVTAVGLSVVLLFRARDWRMGFLAVMLVFMALRQALALVANPGPPTAGLAGAASELPGLAVSVLAFVAVIFLGRMLAERKQAEKVLQKSEQHLRNVLDSLFALVGVMTPDGVLTEANRTALEVASLKPEDAVGKPFEETYWWSYSPAVQAQLRAAIQRAAEGETVRYDVHIRLGEGRFIIIDFALTPIFDSEGRVSHLIPSAVDISERKQTEEALRQREEQLRQSQKMEAVGILAGGIAHDFNNMLAVILGNTELALASLAAESVERANLEEVMKAGQRAKALVQQILVFSRRGEERRDLLELHTVVDDVLRLVRASLPTTIAIRKQIDRRADTVRADPTQIQQVLVNLCTNAAYAMRDKGGDLMVKLDSVEVGASRAVSSGNLEAGPYVRLTIKDSGHGISPEVMPRIFEPFFTTKGRTEGIGMGLAVVHGIVEGHGGAVAVESAPGKGATFEVFLPRTEEAASPEQVAERPMPKGSGRVLLVDDEASVVRMGRQMLESLGYEVVAHTTSDGALAAFRATPGAFTTVVTDYTMPRMTGAVLAVELLRIRPDIPIILCTGFSETITPEEAGALGIREHLMKPFSREELAESLHRVTQQPAIAI